MTEIINLHHPAWDAEMPSETGALRAVRLEQGAVVSPLHFHHGNEELLTRRKLGIGEPA
jgi:hypothetical protein